MTHWLKHDARDLAFVVGTLAILWGVWQLHKTQGQLHSQERQRIADLRASCRHTSRVTASDVNLNWEYYQSEIELAGPAHPKSVTNLKRLLPGLSVSERAFFVALLNQGNPTRGILLARAHADYDAAWTKATRVDVGDVKLVTAGPPQAWVINDQFSCAKAYPES